MIRLYILFLVVFSVIACGSCSQSQKVNSVNIAKNWLKDYCKVDGVVPVRAEDLSERLTSVYFEPASKSFYIEVIVDRNVSVISSKVVGLEKVENATLGLGAFRERVRDILDSRGNDLESLVISEPVVHEGLVRVFVQRDNILGTTKIFTFLPAGELIFEI